MGPSALEVADIFRAHGPAFRLAQRAPEPGPAQGHVSDRTVPHRGAGRTRFALPRTASTIRCPTTPAATGIAPSARPLQPSAGWRPGKPICLPVDYYHVVFTLPAPISDIAYYNKAVVYGLLFEIAAETLTTIAADPSTWAQQVG
jgi:hypothetical protein